MNEKTHLIIMSGLPGSGKSYQARALSRKGKGGVVVSADHMHCPALMEELQEDGLYTGIPFARMSDTLIQELLGIYEFDPKNLSDAHQKCMKAVLYWLQAWKVDPFTIVVDNTNIHTWEMSPYYLVGEAIGASVGIHRVETPLEVCIKRNIHGVPDAIIAQKYSAFMEMDSRGKPKQHLPWWISQVSQFH